MAKSIDKEEKKKKKQEKEKEKEKEKENKKEKAAAGATAEGGKSGEDANAEADKGKDEAAADKERLKWENVIPIAKPLVTKKLHKKALKLVKRAAKNKWQLKRGVKEVGKAVRKGTKGLCLLAGDISPIDVISHLPVLCEESDVPYAYVPSREDLGTAASTKRSTSVVMILERPIKGDVSEDELKAFKADYEDLKQELESLALAAFKR